MELERTADNSVANVEVIDSIIFTNTQRRIDISISYGGVTRRALLSPSEVDDLIVMLTYHKLEVERKEKEDAVTKKSSG